LFAQSRTVSSAVPIERDRNVVGFECTLVGKQSERKRTLNSKLNAMYLELQIYPPYTAESALSKRERAREREKAFGSMLVLKTGN
jgi:hypothetical protein